MKVITFFCFFELYGLYVKVDSRRQIINQVSPTTVLFFSLVLLLRLSVNVVDLYGQSLYLLVLSQLHLTHKIRYYQVYQCIGGYLVSKLVDFLVTCHHPVQFLALLQLLRVKMPQNTVKVTIWSTLKGYIKLHSLQDRSFQSNNFLL